MNKLVVYTDGSSRGNPGPGGYGAICVFKDSEGDYYVKEIGGREEMTTNNRMELQALISALQFILNRINSAADAAVSENIDDSKINTQPIQFQDPTLYIYIDSSYVLKGAKEWLSGWKKNGWISSTKAEVKNIELWQQVDYLIENLNNRKIKLDWNLVKGHVGVPGNERCDVIATTFADNGKAILFDGKMSNYFLPNILDLTDSEISFETKSEFESVKKISNKNKKNGQIPYSYVSYVDGIINIDKSWADCEVRVKGKSGAKFKKVFSKTEEDEVIKEFTK